MKDKLYIPKKIKVGYVKREDTYTKKLAYVIYYDDKGILRKETSWEGWRDQSIPVDDFENKPHSGFILNKDVKRSSEWFGSGRNMIRVYDDRGIEFEITTGNLIFILMTTNCHKRGLEGEFVYAWYKKDLILLPVGCEEYEASTKFTKLQAGKIGAKDLVPGCSYKTKQLEDLIYLGKFDFYTYDWYELKKIPKIKKQYVFLDSKNEIIPMTILSSLASKNTDIPVTNYAELMDIYTKSKYASPVKSIEWTFAKNIDFKENEKIYYIPGNFYKVIGTNKFINCSIKRQEIYDSSKREVTGIYYNIVEHKTIEFKDHVIHVSSPSYNYSNHNGKKYSLSDLKEMEFVDLFVNTEFGGKIKFEVFNTY